MIKKHKRNKLHLATINEPIKERPATGTVEFGHEDGTVELMPYWTKDGHPMKWEGKAL